MKELSTKSYVSKAIVRNENVKSANVAYDFLVYCECVEKYYI
jgi:hypothetical protein